MKSQSFLSTLALAILFVVPTATGQSTFTSHQETTTIKTSNSTQDGVEGNSEENQTLVENYQSPEPTYYSPRVNSWTMEPDSSHKQERVDDQNQPAPMNQPLIVTNSTLLTQSSYDNPSTSVECPGPADPATGEAVLDYDSNCTIVCYNNLVLNESGDACICPPTFHFDPVQVKCVCRSPFVQRGSKCVLLPSQAPAARHASHKKRSLNGQVPLDIDMLHGKYRRSALDRANCPSNEIACPLPSGGFECLDPDTSLDSCGGCSSNKSGTDCSSLPGVMNVGCHKGGCVVFSCQQGFRLVDGGCVTKNHRKA